MTASRLSAIGLRLPPGPGRLPLPITGLTIALLLVAPAVALLRFPRPVAEGLEQLMDTSSLLQSFPASPQRPTPALWQERLGPRLAARVWSQQRRTWWQFWGPHADGAPYLALQASALPLNAAAGRLPPGALRVGDLLVLSPDPLSRQLLADRLRPRQRPSRGLQRRCLQRIQQGQAVYWNPNALGVILGPVAPLLQPFQAGCLSLDLAPGELRWQGEAAAVDGVLTASGAETVGLAPVTLPPLGEDALLEIRGGSLEPLLQGLLSRQLIRDPLASRYGLTAQRLPLLRSAPFQLRLRPRTSGPYQAALELQLITGRQRAPWDTLLTGVARALREQGLQDREPQDRGPDEAAGASEAKTPNPPGAATPANPPAGTARPPGPPAAVGASRGVTLWRRPDGQVVGGWRWIPAAGGESQLLLFLGPEPVRSQPIPRGADARPPDGQLVVRVRPRDLDALGLLPAEMPPLVRRAEQLGLRTAPQASGREPDRSVSLLSGALQLPR